MPKLYTLTFTHALHYAGHTDRSREMSVFRDSGRLVITSRCRRPSHFTAGELRVAEAAVTRKYGGVVFRARAETGR